MDTNQALDKVRKLLAQAESEAEVGNTEAGEAFRSKATELLTRYQLDEAMIAPAPTTAEVKLIKLECVGHMRRRWWNLLNVVAVGSNCKSVGRRESRAGVPGREVYVVDVIGFETDLEAVQILWTSLMAQATSGIQQLTVPPGLNAHVMWRNFLDGFNHAIHVRLERQRATLIQEVAATDAGVNLLPVLRDRSARVDEFVDKQYATLRKGRTTGATSTGHGRREGRAAGNRATLGGGQVGGGARGELG